MIDKKLRVFLNKDNKNQVQFFEVVKFFIEYMNLSPVLGGFVRVKEDCIEFGRNEFKIFLVDTSGEKFEERFIGMMFNFMVVDRNLLNYSHFRMFNKYSDKVMVID